MATRRKPVKSSKTAKPRKKASRPLGARLKENSAEDKELSATERRELARRIEDLDDRTRYLIVSSIGERITLYYNIADDTYSWDEPKAATLFKRKAAAQKILAMLGKGVRVIECSVDKRGQLLKKSIQLESK